MNTEWKNKISNVRMRLSTPEINAKLALIKAKLDRHMGAVVESYSPRRQYRRQSPIRRKTRRSKSRSRSRRRSKSRRR